MSFVKCILIEIKMLIIMSQKHHATNAKNRLFLVTKQCLVTYAQTGPTFHASKGMTETMYEALLNGNKCNSSK